MGKISSAFGMLLGLASGCSSTSSIESLPPGQVDAVPAPTEARAPSGSFQSPPATDEPGGPLPGCPASREDSTVELSGAADLRARLPGIYRTCLLGRSSVELRIDPSSDTRLLWYALDDRFVRIQGGSGATGTIDVIECTGATCTVEWYGHGLDEQFETMRTLTVWADPTAVVIESGPEDQRSWSEWIRVAR